MKSAEEERHPEALKKFLLVSGRLLQLFSPPSTVQKNERFSSALFMSFTDL
jgi:hypothetical protein